MMKNKIDKSAFRAQEEYKTVPTDGKEALNFYLKQLREFNHNDAADFIFYYIKEIEYRMEKAELQLRFARAKQDREELLKSMCGGF